MKELLKSALILNLVLAGPVSVKAHTRPIRQDITGAAASIFKRPENPPAQAHGGKTTNKQRSSKDERRDQVEDAIALGNVARDRKPPDFQSAERAYRLALKLNPRDPRPYVGLGNLYWDQRRYLEAASSYREAMRHMELKINDLYAGIGFGISKARSRASESSAQVQLYLAAALLEVQNPLSAERELRLIAFSHRDKAEWNALFGYALAEQGRYSEAVAAFEKVVELEPLNAKYQELLGAVRQKARETSTNDQAITSRLQNTVWDVQDATGSTVKATCNLNPNGTVQCKTARGGIGLPKATWKIRDGIVGFESTSKTLFCLGQLSEETIAVKCYSGDREITELWKLRRR